MRAVVLALTVATAGIVATAAQAPRDWSQWRGLDSIGLAELSAAAQWPATLTKRWEVAVPGEFAISEEKTH
jgi:hypothetical protein